MWGPLAGGSYLAHILKLETSTIYGEVRAGNSGMWRESFNPTFFFIHRSARTREISTPVLPRHEHTCSSFKHEDTKWFVSPYSWHVMTLSSGSKYARKNYIAYRITAWIINSRCERVWDKWSKLVFLVHAISVKYVRMYAEPYKILRRVSQGSMILVFRLRVDSELAKVHWYAQSFHVNKIKAKYKCLTVW